MNPRQLDRRVRRTRRRLKEALLGLIQERPYEAVTVQNIIDRADVGRSTFYSHFRSKEELLFDGFGQTLETFTRGPLSPPGQPPNHARFPFARPLLEHFQKQSRFFLATLVDASDPKVRRELTRWLAKSIQTELAGRRPSAAVGGAPRTDLEAKAHCIAAAFLGLAGWWLKNGQALSAEDVDGLFREVLAD